MNFLGLELNKPKIKSFNVTLLFSMVMFFIGYYFILLPSLTPILSGFFLAITCFSGGILSDVGLTIKSIKEKPTNIIPIIIIFSTVIIILTMFAYFLSTL